MATAQEKRAAFLDKWLPGIRDNRQADEELRRLMHEHVERVVELPKASVTTLASAFADVFESTEAGPPDWTEAEVEAIAGAFEKIGRPKAAEQLREKWAQHKRQQE